MARGTLKQANFGGGVLSPLLEPRADLQKHQTGLRDGSLNVIPLPQGAFMKRPGTKWICPTKVAADAARVFPFQYSVTAAYVVLGGDLTFRFIKNYALVTDTSTNITGITQASPGVVTANSHGLSNGNRVWIASVGGMQEVNNREFTVANVTANTFELSGINTSAYTAFTSGGTVKRIYEIVSPYADDQLDDVTYVQSADVLYMFHPTIAPYKLTRTADTSWTMTAMTFTDGPFAPVNSTPSARVRVQHTDARKNYRPGKSTTILSNTDIFTSDHVGSLFYMEEILLDQLDVAPWESAHAPGSVNDQKSNDGHVYELVSTLGSVTGTAAPTHTDGDAWDGINEAGAGGESTKWRYLHSRYSVFRITAYTSAKEVTADIVTQCPTGFNQPSKTITNATSDGGVIRLTSAAHGLSDDDYVYVTGVTGTTEANGYWQIEDVATNTFNLKGSTFVNAYSAGGTARRFATWLYAFGAFSAERGYPACGTLFQDRLVMGGTEAQPDSVWTSVTGNYSSFADKEHGIVRDDSSVAFTLASPQVNRIRWMSPDGSGLLIGTAGSEWFVRPATTSKAFAPGNVDAKPQSGHGSKAIGSILAGSATLFVDRSGRKVMEPIYDASVDRYVSQDLTLISNTITKGGIVDMAFVQKPDNIVWMPRADGALVGLTYNREQQIAGFHPHVLGGYSDGSQTQAVVESVCSLPSPDGTRDDLYMVVKRYINGGVVRHVEYMDRSWDIDEGAIEDQYFVDGGATYDGSSASTIGGLYFLRGETLQCLVDGGAHPDVTVSATGFVTLDRAGSVVQLGYGYNAIGAMLPSDFASQTGSATGKTKKISKLALWVYRSATFDAGPDENNLDPIIIRDNDDDMDTPTPLHTGILDLTWPDGYSLEAPVMVQQSKPMAMAVMALVPTLTVQEGS